MIFFIRLPDSIDEHLLYASHQETLPLEFSRKAPDVSQNDSVIALLPADRISFVSLPLPSGWMTLKKKYEFIRHNIPDDIIYDENEDELIIWTSESKEIIFAIVNKALWLAWCDMFQNVNAIIPEWQLVPCPTENAPVSHMVWHGHTLVRTAKWNGYSTVYEKNDEERQKTLPLNIQQLIIDINRTPFPLELSIFAKKKKTSSFFYFALTGFLLASVIVQSLQVYSLRQAYLLSLSQDTGISIELHDGFTPLLNTLGKINDRIQFKLTTMDYHAGTANISLLSYNDCQKLSEELKLNNKNINIHTNQNSESIWRCMAQIEMKI